jgi:hypothetical protein
MVPFFSIETAPALLALTDRNAAAEMLRQIAAGQGSLPRPEGRGAGDRWLIAWGLADLQHARTRVATELAAIGELKGSQLLRLAELLTALAARRAELLWGPDRQDLVSGTGPAGLASCGRPMAPSIPDGPRGGTFPA